MNIKWNFVKDFISYIIVFLFAISIGYGLKSFYVWYSAPRTIIIASTDAHFVNTKKPVVIYTTKWCPYCKALRSYLSEKDIAFEDRDIELDNMEINELYSSVGVNVTPIIIVEGKILIGFNKMDLDSELSAIN